MRLHSLLAGCGLLLAHPRDALAMLDVVSLPRQAQAGVHLSVTEGKDGELDVTLGLGDGNLGFAVGGVSVWVYEKGPDGKARVVTRFSPASRQKDGRTQTQFTVQRRHARNTTIGLDTGAPWPGCGSRSRSPTSSISAPTYRTSPGPICSGSPSTKELSRRSTRARKSAPAGHHDGSGVDPASHPDGHVRGREVS